MNKDEFNNRMSEEMRDCYHDFLNFHSISTERSVFRCLYDTEDFKTFMCSMNIHPDQYAEHVLDDLIFGHGKPNDRFQGRDAILKFINDKLVDLMTVRFKKDEITPLHLLYLLMKDVSLYPVQIFHTHLNFTHKDVLAYLQIKDRLFEKVEDDPVAFIPLTSFHGSYNTPDEKTNTNTQEVEYCDRMTSPDFEIPTVIGRDKEVQKLIDNLCRMNKRNAILLGESGVGKTTIMYKLVDFMRQKKVPFKLQGIEVYSLSMAALIAGTSYRGQFEERMNKLIAKLKAMKKHVIVYIDEIHTMMGAGETTKGGSMDFSNIIKPTLGSNITWVGSTTNEEYRRKIAKDDAIVRRFAVVDVPEPSLDEVRSIVEGRLPAYEKDHGVEYQKDAVEHAIMMSQKYITARAMPDTTLDVIDRIGVIASKGVYGDRTVYKEYVDTIVADILNVPLTTITNGTNLSDLENRVKGSIYGQDHVVEAVVKSFRRYKAGLTPADKPIGSYLFVGATGTGKTEVAKVTARETGANLIRLDMSEYMEPHSVSKLLGTSAGYVGYEDGGLLVKELKKNPHAIILLDEIEKAHPSIMKIFLQVMDNGYVTTADGTRLDCRHVMLIFTSNCGVVESERNGIGFGDVSREDAIMGEVDRYFPPEFRNRLTGILKFNRLDKTLMGCIVTKALQNLSGRLQGRGINFVWNTSLVDYLSDKGYSHSMGARPVNKLIEDKVESLLTDMILSGNVISGNSLNGVFEDEVQIQHMIMEIA